MGKNYVAMLYSFLEKKRSNTLMDEYKKLGFSGGTFTFGNGAATSMLWRLVGFEGPERAVLINLVDKKMLEEYMEHEDEIKKKVYFQSALVPLDREAVSEVLNKEEILMDDLSFVQVIWHIALLVSVFGSVSYENGVIGLSPYCSSSSEKSIDERRTLGGVPVLNLLVFTPNFLKDSPKNAAGKRPSGPDS